MKKLGLLLVSLMTLVTLSACGASIQAKDYLEYELKGINGKATISAYMKRDALASDALGLKTESDYMNLSMKQLEQYDDIYDGVEYSFDKDEGLSNGDTVVVTFNVSDKAKGVKDSQLKIKVEGLDEGEKVTLDELKDSVLFNVTGASGRGTASLENLSKKNYLYGLDFTFENNGKLKNGEKVKVTVENPESVYAYAADDGKYYVLEDGALEFEVEGLTEVPEDISKMSNYGDIKKLIEERAANNYKYRDKYTIKGFYYRQFIPNEPSISSGGGWYSSVEYGQLAALVEITDYGDTYYEMYSAGGFEDNGGKLDIKKAESTQRLSFDSSYSLGSIEKIIENDDFIKLP